MALEIAPTNAKLWHSKGLAFQGQAEGGDESYINKAIEMYRQAIQLQEGFVSSRFHLGLMYHKLKRYIEAIKCFSRVIDRIKDDKTVYIARGIVYFDMGNYSLAIQDFTQAIHYDESDPVGYFRRGFSFFYAKRYKDAMEDFVKANEYELDMYNEDMNIERNPGIHDGLGCCNHALGFFEQAIIHFDKALDMSPTNTEFLMHKAQCEYDQQNFE